MLVFVQISELACALIVLPAGMLPARLVAPVPFVTVLPLAVLVAVFVVVVFVLVVVLVAPARPPAGALAPEVAGTSVSCGCAAVSLPASARSRLSVVSAASAVSALFLSPLHAARSANAPTTIGMVNRPVYFVMRIPLGGKCKTRSNIDLAQQARRARTPSVRITSELDKSL